ncbi:hypothetical protein ACYJ1Y_16025 [Natrialbaceae archaeon A-gly3]
MVVVYIFLGWELSFAMAKDDFPSNQHTPPYPLSSTQRKYISNGDTGNSWEAKLQEDVQKKIDQLGERFERLFSDVELLYKNGYLEEEYYVDAWAELLGFDEDDEWGEILEACQLHADVEDARPTSAPQEVARQFGQLLFRLMLTPDEISDPESVMKELAWGFLQGLYLDSADGILLGDARREAIEGTIEHLEERLEVELDYDEPVISFHKEWQEQREASKEAEQAIHDRIREVLDGIEGVEPQGYGVGLENHQRGIDPREVFTLLIDRLTEDPAPEEDGLAVDNTLGTAGQQVLFERQYGPLTEIDVDEIVTREDVLAVIKEYNLATKDEIAARVYEDVEALEDAGGYKGVDDAAEVVRVIHKADGSPRSAAIARAVATESHKGSVTALCNCLTGGKRLKGQEELADRAAERPILTGESDGWGLSVYGEFIGNELKVRERRKRSPFAELQSIQFNAGLGDHPSDLADRLAEAADEIGLEMLERSLEQ